MRVYDQAQDELLFLAQYCVVDIKPTVTRITSTLFVASVEMNCPSEQASRLLADLQKGMCEDEVIYFFHNNLFDLQPELRIEEWMRAGVLE